MKLGILASHPVQYHAPVFRQVHGLLAARGHETVVIYLSDCSVRGYLDREFGVPVRWDEPLLEGYASVFEAGAGGQTPSGFASLRVANPRRWLASLGLDRLLVTSLNYRATVEMLLAARYQGIPCTLRVETTDDSFVRGRLKSALRSLAYRTLYRSFDSACHFGRLNREHLLAHGFRPDQLSFSPFATRDRVSPLPLEERLAMRSRLRAELGVADGMHLLLFCGKLIEKKNPRLLLDALSLLPASVRARMGTAFVGSGELEQGLRTQAAGLGLAAWGFAGFVNQSELPAWYLAADSLVLPSRRAGEVWGLVVNEGLQAGLPCIVSDAVGAGVEFAHLPGFEVFPSEDAMALAQAIQRSSALPRDFDRYRVSCERYSFETAAQGIVAAVLADRPAVGTREAGA